MSIETRIKDAALWNTSLLHTLRETDSARANLDAQNRYISDLEAQARDANERLKQLESARKRELKEHESLRDSKVRRLAYKAVRKTDRFERKASKEEQDYMIAVKEEEKASVLKTNLDGMLEEASKARGDLEGKYSVHIEAQRDLDGLYESIFQEPSGFDEEEARKRELDHARHLHYEAQARTGAEAQAVQALRRAQLRLDSASTAMDTALRRSRQDMYGGGTYTDILEGRALSQANSDLQEAQQLVNQARRYSPLVHDLPSASIAQGNMLGDVVFDNIFSDAQFHQKIRQSALEVQGCMQALSVDLQAATHRHAERSREMDAAKAAVRKAKLNLQRAREAVFEMLGAASLAEVAPPPGPPPAHGGDASDNWWES